MWNERSVTQVDNKGSWDCGLTLNEKLIRRSTHGWRVTLDGGPLDDGVKAETKAGGGRGSFLARDSLVCIRQTGQSSEAGRKLPRSWLSRTLRQWCHVSSGTYHLGQNQCRVLMRMCRALVRMRPFPNCRAQKDWRWNAWPERQVQLFENL